MLRVLIVEDDALTAMYLEGVINDVSTAHIVITTSVSDTRDALNSSFDLAFLDVDVTNGKTFELARSLLKKEVPFVFVSGSLRTEVPEELQFAPFIGKPFQRSDIVGVLSSLFDE